jgi:hypothetical protein
MQKKPPCTLGGKNVFFQGSTNRNGFRRGLDYQLFFKDLESGLVGHYLVSLSEWISFVADTKMRKTTSGVKIFRPTFVFPRRTSKMPDERQAGRLKVPDDRQSPVGWIALVSTISITV